MLTRYTLLFVGFMAFAFGLHAQNYNMTSTIVNTCAGNFYDDGGPSSNYTASMTGPMTFKPDDSNKHMTLHFSTIKLSPYDQLRIYNGSGTSGTVLGTISGGTTSDVAFSSTEVGNALTVQYLQGYYDTAEGWDAVLPPRRVR